MLELVDIIKALKGYKLLRIYGKENFDEVMCFGAIPLFQYFKQEYILQIHPENNNLKSWNY